MLINKWMSKDVITIDVNDSMHQAIKLLKEHNIRMLPVMKKGKLVGIVTDRDLKQASASNATSLDIHELIYLLMKIKLKEIMTKNPITIPFNYTVDETAAIFLSNKISGAPVVDDSNRLVGVITEADLFRLILSHTGVRKKGIGSDKAINDVIRSYVWTSHGQHPELV